MIIIEIKQVLTFCEKLKKVLHTILLGSLSLLFYNIPMKKLYFRVLIILTLLMKGIAMASPAQPSNPSTIIGKVLHLELQTRKTEPDQHLPTKQGANEPVAPITAPSKQFWYVTLEVIDCKTFSYETQKEIAPEYKKETKIKLFLNYDKNITVGDTVTGSTPSVSSYLPIFSVSNVEKRKASDLNLEYREFNPTKEEKEELLKIIKNKKLHGPHLRTLVSKTGTNYRIYVGSENPYQGGSGQEYTFDSKTKELKLNYTEELAPAPEDLEDMGEPEGLKDFKDD